MRRVLNGSLRDPRSAEHLYVHVSQSSEEHRMREWCTDMIAVAMKALFTRSAGYIYFYVPQVFRHNRPVLGVHATCILTCSRKIDRHLLHRLAEWATPVLACLIPASSLSSVIVLEPPCGTPLTHVVLHGPKKRFDLASKPAYFPKGCKHALNRAVTPALRAQ
eukprot:4214364-Pyramimonas_sp.AAC.1